MGHARPHDCLTVDEILSHFGHRKAVARRRYGEFVQAGLAGPSIWGELQAQSLLGVEGFTAGLRRHVTGKQKIREFPKGQRFAGRPALAKLFSKKGREKRSRDALIAKAVNEYGYGQAELASHLDLHYSTISRIVKTTSHPGSHSS